MSKLPTSRDIRRTFNATLDTAIAAPVYFKRNETVFRIERVKPEKDYERKIEISRESSLESIQKREERRNITDMTYDDYKTYEISPEFLKKLEERRNRIFGNQV